MPAESQLVAYITIEALVGLAVFACTAVLGEVTPGRHVQFERRPTTHVAPVARPGGGGPRSGTVTPPRGDAAHGRAVFGRLECATCHAIPDAQFWRRYDQGLTWPGSADATRARSSSRS